MNNISELPLPNELMPRAKFKAAGTVVSAAYAREVPKFPTPGTTSRAQRLGKRYENKVIREVKKQKNPSFIYGPWLYYTNSDHASRYCQPDMLLLDNDERRCFIFEIKYTHTIDAYFQLKKLYLPVLSFMYPSYKMHLIEITRSYDPAVKFPCGVSGLSFSLADAISSSLESSENEIGVLQWKL